MKAGPWQFSDAVDLSSGYRFWDNGVEAAHVFCWRGCVGDIIERGRAYDPKGYMLADVQAPLKYRHVQAWLDRAIEQWEAKQ